MGNWLNSYPLGDALPFQYICAPFITGDVYVCLIWLVKIVIRFHCLIGLKWMALYNRKCKGLKNLLTAAWNQILFMLLLNGIYFIPTLPLNYTLHKLQSWVVSREIFALDLLDQFYKFNHSLDSWHVKSVVQIVWYIEHLNRLETLSVFKCFFLLLILAGVNCTLPIPQVPQIFNFVIGLLFSRISETIWILQQYT